jgi:glycerophosphoryl diester phosphodiesterase
MKFPGATGGLSLSHVHRGGGAAERPDNTLETFLWCWEHGAAVECDCRRTRDGVGIMLHDPTLRRTARGVSDALADADVSSELDWADIRDIDVGSYLSPAFAHHRIPTIDAVFAAMEGHPERLCFVDEKGFGPQAIAEKAREHGVLDQIYYTGMWYDKTLEWTRIVPGGKTMFWIGTFPGPSHDAAGAAAFEAYDDGEMGKLRAGNFEGVSLVSLHVWCDWEAPVPLVPRPECLGRYITELHARGIPVAAMPFEGGAVEETYLRLRELGFDAFSTDHPSVLFRVLRRLKGA